MAEEQLYAELNQLRISQVGGIMSGQGSTLGDGHQGGYSEVKEAQQQDLTNTENKINLPIEGILPVDSLSFKIELGSGDQVPSAPIQKKLELKKSSLQGLLQEKTSFEDWQVHFQNISTEFTSPAYWNEFKMVSPSTNSTTAKKLRVKKLPFKHKNLLTKPKLVCLQGNPKTKSQAWIKDILKTKVKSSNLLQKSKLNCGQVKPNVNSSEWLKSIPDTEEENSNWAKNIDTSLAFKTLKPLSDHKDGYDMKALNNECEKMEIEKQINKNPRNPYDFQGLIEECKNLEDDIYEPRTLSSMPRSDSDDVTPNELAGYIDTIMHIPKKMSAMAEAMYL